MRPLLSRYRDLFMWLKELHIQGFRNLRNISLAELGQFNLVHGGNGSGKTSILEALHMLSLTRSFRSRQVASVVNYDSSVLLVRALLLERGSGDLRSLGVQRGRDKSLLVKFAGERLRSFSDLAGLLPVQLINPDSFQLFEGAPAVRRQFLDWSVFHVKHLGFYEEWSRYRKALKQRNTLLRRGKLADALLAPWEEEIAQTGAKITVMRRAQFCQTAEAFAEIMAQLQMKLVESGGALLDLQPFSMRFNSGWDDEGEDDNVAEDRLRALLADNREQDGRQGYTRVGPHRADIRFNYGALNAADVLSRGQIKMLVCALKLAQCQLMRQQGLDVVLLADDLPAELDRQRREALFSMISTMGVQLFATAISGEDLNDSWFSRPERVKRFHVEHLTVGK